MKNSIISRIWIIDFITLSDIIQSADLTALDKMEAGVHINHGIAIKKSPLCMDNMFHRFLFDDYQYGLQW